MRHHNRIKKFGRERNQRTALMRSLACSLVKHERIETTQAKAKALRPYIERLVTKGKVNSIASRRLLSERLGGAPQEIKKIVSTIAPRYKDRAGGYTRITKLPVRKSDAAKRAVIEFVK